MIERESETVSSTVPNEGVTVVRSRSQPAFDEHHDHDHAFAHLADWRTHWGPVFAGLLVMATCMMFLTMFGAAVGLTAFNAGTAAAQGGPPGDVGRNAGIWEGFSMIVSFFVGGYVASKTAGLIDKNWGAWHGAMVFFLAVPFFFVFAYIGLGAMMGGLGAYLSGFHPVTIATTAQSAAASNPTAVGQTAAQIRDATWAAFFGAILGLAASAIGGYVGAHNWFAERQTHTHTTTTAAY